jgi:class 3 adenylate cyclase/HAMP domain-containing protein
VSSGNIEKNLQGRGDSVKMRKKHRRILGVCAVIFVLCFVSVVMNFPLLKRPVFQAKTDFLSPSVAKYEKDGNLYIVDNAGFRLVSMTTDGKINYTINIDKMKEYTRIYDLAVDEMGNLYIYVMEADYDAFLTKRDMIRKYNRDGKLEKTILTIDYDEHSEDRPHVFPQFGSMRSEKSALTFSRIRKNTVELYAYDIYRDHLDKSEFYAGAEDYSVGCLAAKDFENFAYVTRDGDIYEVKNGGLPLLRASFNFTEKEGNENAQQRGGDEIIPWYPVYENDEDIIFVDMMSSLLYRMSPSGDVTKILPEKFFDDLRSQGIVAFTNYGFWESRFAGVFIDHVWFYNGFQFQTYENGIILPLRERIGIIIAQVALVLGIIAFVMGIYFLFAKILGWYISLIIKQTVIIIPLTIAAFVMLYMIMFDNMRSRLNNELIGATSLLASMYSTLINGDDLENLKSAKDSRTEAYKNIVQMTKNAVGDNKDPWNKAYYAAVYKVLDGVEYIVAVSNNDANLFRPYGFSVEEGSDEYLLITDKKPFTSINPNYTGSWIYSNFPICNSRGDVTGIFEIGLDLTAYDISNTILARNSSIMVTIIVLVILVSLIVIMTFVIKHLSRIGHGLESIAKGEYSLRVDYPSRDELGLVSSGLNHMAEELEHNIEHIKKMNESTIRFVPVQFMEYLGVTDITKLKLGDHVRRDLSVLFFDIRSFSIHSEILSARENFFFINEILSIAGPILRNHNGFVDKFIGDAAMAIFVNARDAVRAGIEVYHKIVLDGATRVKIGADGINIGVGIHTGSVMMGIVGEPERLSSTVISKNVNLASRVESLTKQTKSGMLITRDTLNQMSGSENEFHCRFIGLVQAAGVNEVVGLFDMLDALPESIRKRRLATKRVFESGIRKYHTKEYQAARKRFQMVVEVDPTDVCAATCLAETEKHLKNPKLPSVFIYDKK